MPTYKQCAINDNMNGKFVHIKSFGCQMNKLDTALVTSALTEAGFTITEKLKQANVVLINTCSVREHAEQRVLSHLGHLKHIKKTRPELVVGVIGCMAQRLGDNLLEDGTVDIVCGPGQIPQITKLVKEALEKRQKQISISEHIRKKSDDDIALEEFESIYDRADAKTPGHSYVRVMRGCDNFCSYCIVPYVRGPEVSRPPEKIIEQIKRLADEGIKFITLLGQAVNKYKYTSNDKNYTLADLLYMISEINGIEWIRFVTNYPQQAGFEELLRAMADLPKVCKYLHLPAQSGSDKILQAMNRHYTVQQYLELIDKAKQIVPSITISGDFIVGFPDETDEDFQKTVELVEKVRYKNCFIFKYSPRPGTTAQRRLADTIPDEIKRKRNIELLAVQERISSELAIEFVGKEISVFVEGLSKKPDSRINVNTDWPQLVGRSSGDWPVVFNGPESLAGRFTRVKITHSSAFTLFGELLDKNQ